MCHNVIRHLGTLAMTSQRSSGVYRPERFAHLARDGLVTVLGFGSLVSEASARESFDFINFRLGTVMGVQRIFNRADWINIDNADARVSTAEVCSLAMAVIGAAAPEGGCRVALMDVSADEGVAGFLHRESTYRILEVPFLDDRDASGIALACGECEDSDIVNLWGDDVWYLEHCTGQIWYVNGGAGGVMSLVPPVHGEPGDPSVWLPFTLPDQEQCHYVLPPGPCVYPAPGYLRMVYLAHLRAGIADNFLNTTLLMDRITTLRTYLDGNPALKEWVLDPEAHADRESDRYES